MKEMPSVIFGVSIDDFCLLDFRTIVYIRFLIF